MTDETTTTLELGLPGKRQFNWHTLVPKPEVHACNCELCGVVGELEPILWPTLTTFTFEGQPYVTDRVLALRVERAPIPDDWGLPPDQVSTPPLLSYWSWRIADVPPTGVRFNEVFLSALRTLGWRLRRPVVPVSATGVYGKHLAAVVDEHGAHIGWLMGRSSGGELYVEPGVSRSWRETQESCPRCGVESGRAHALGEAEGGCAYDGPPEHPGVSR